MPSVLSNPVRAAPQQKRSERRLAAFLDAAAALFAELGYEAATMTAIAERSASSIGALFNYFPHKQAIALTLVNQYGQELEAYWRPLIEQAAKLTHREFADLFIERITELVQQRPAYLSLATAPVRFRRPPAAKVTLQMVSGLMMLYAEAAPKGKDLVVDEFKKVLTSYLGTIVYQEDAG